MNVLQWGHDFSAMEMKLLLRIKDERDFWETLALVLPHALIFWVYLFLK